MYILELLGVFKLADHKSQMKVPFGVAVYQNISGTKYWIHS